MPVNNEKRMSTFDLGGHYVNNSQKHLKDLLKKLDLPVVPRDFKNNFAIKQMDKNGIFFAKNSPMYFKNVCNRLQLFKFFEKVFNRIRAVMFLI